MSDNAKSDVPAETVAADSVQATPDESEPNAISDRGGESPSAEDGAEAAHVAADGDSSAAETAAPAGDTPAASDSQKSSEVETDGDGQAEVSAAAGEPTAEGRIAELEAEVSRIDKERQANWDRALRATADLENVRRRSRRELDDARIETRTKVLKEMLPVIDNLERAIEHAEQGELDEKQAGILDGVKLVLRQFAQALERFDVRVVEAVGQPFDPNLHEAISQMETSEHPPGAVAQAFQTGYTIGSRLLRPALVVVAKAPPEPAPETSAGADSDAAAADADDAASTSGTSGEDEA